MVQVNSPAVDRRPLPDVNMSTGPSPKCTPHFPFPGGELPLGECSSAICCQGNSHEHGGLSVLRLPAIQC